jgi:hypothetical protein
MALTWHAAECIRHYIPRAKLIVMRDPAERAVSVRSDVLR